MGPVVQTVPGMAGANADVDTCSSHDIQVGSVMGPLGQTQRSSLRAAESKGILRAAPASVHASELFSFMPWFKKKKKNKTLEKGTVRTVVENDNSLAVGFVCCLSYLSPLAVKTSLRWDHPTRWSQARQ